MMTVHEVSESTGVSARALHLYDEKGLLRPAGFTEAGYRLYDEASLERLQQILLFKELAFSLEEIKSILDAPDFDRSKALSQQIELLELKKEHLQNLIDLARGIQTIGVQNMNFDAFDTKKIDEYAAKAKEAWGKTAAYKEFEEKSAGRSKETQQSLNLEMMDIFRRMGELKDGAPDSEGAKALARELQQHITQHYYSCTDEILLSLGEMYAAGGAFTENIDKAGGEGTAVFANRAIRAMIEAK